MAAEVYVPTPYRQFAGGQVTVTVEPGTVLDVLAALVARYPGLRGRVLDEAGQIPGHLNVYVNDVEVRSLQGDTTPVRDGDEIALVPAMAGGATTAPNPLLSETQIERYQRQVILEELGVAGQRKLLDSKVLIVGAGGLGSPSSIYLAAAGVGTLGIIDADRVDRTNLHRQILHFDHDVGRPKTQSARRHLEDINPEVRVIEHATMLTAANALEVIRDYDLVINGSDNFPTRYLINDACVLLGKPLVDASILKWDGQATVFLPGKGCYRCLFPSPPPPGTVPSCAEGGILGALAGHMGTLQAIETVKVLLGVGDPFSNRIVLFDALRGKYRTLRWDRNPNCPVCGDRPTITGLIDYDAFCGLPSTTAGAAATGPELTLPEDRTELSVQDAVALLGRDDILWLDIRQQFEYARDHIPGSLLIPLDELPDRVDEIPGDRPIVCICEVGQRSAMAVQFLRRKSRPQAYNLAGGLVAWRNRQLPIE